MVLEIERKDSSNTESEMCTKTILTREMLRHEKQTKTEQNSRLAIKNNSIDWSLDEVYDVSGEFIN